MGYLRWIITIPISTVVLYGFRKYIESKWKKCENQIMLDGKTVIVTGANTGIGFEVAKELASRNATVILACRDTNKAEEAINKIKRQINTSGILIPMKLDLGSLRSVAAFSQLFKANHSELHILIHNAGVFNPDTLYTEDGVEIHFGVNYLGPFYLTMLLRDVMASTKGIARIICVSSILHEKGRIILSDLCENEHGRNGYANSKLALTYFCKELSLRTKDEGIQVISVSPGWVYTNLFRNAVRWYHFLVPFVALLLMRTPRQGAETVIYSATEPSLLSGQMYRDCKLYHSKHFFYRKIAVDLWEQSEEIIQTRQIKF